MSSTAYRSNFLRDFVIDAPITGFILLIFAPVFFWSISSLTALRAFCRRLR
jgi:hypothetical protein